MSDVLQGFPLTRHQRDTSEGIELSYWLVSAQGAKLVSLPGQEAVLFVRQQDQAAIAQQLQGLNGWRWQSLALKNLLEQPVAALYCRTLASWHTVIERLKASGIAMMEEDIRPADRYLMERFIFAGAAWTEAGAKSRLTPIDIKPVFRVLSLDIETTMKADRILSIALQSEGYERVMMVGSELAPEMGPKKSHPLITYCADEKRLLQQFVAAVQEFDADILIGWNVIGFDLRVLQRRAEALGVRMQLGRDRQVLRVAVMAKTATMRAWRVGWCWMVSIP
ncbi:3'-5' exonuclease [Nitrincola sp. A-D6]|uniref:3'-5' exonuclease n=1 Tax=Nitrincola sp. A-D6 TaxID=1545442 RepID=UPI001F263287|nr:3'-5' exonuclease [Nitrincola sp. A-D6]